MIMKKKMFVLAFAISPLMIFGMTACGNSSATSDASTTAVSVEATESVSVEEEFAEKPVKFNDIILILDTGFSEGTGSSKKTPYYKDDFGTVTLNYSAGEALEGGVEKSIAEAFDKETLKHDEWYHDQVGAVLFTLNTNFNLRGELFLAAVFNVNDDKYVIQFMPNGYKDQPGKMTEWFRSVIEGMELSDAVSSSVTPVPRVERDFSVAPKPDPGPALNEIFDDLNNASGDEFDALYSESMDRISADGLTEFWELVCSAVSAYTDYLGRTDGIKKTVDEYRLSDYLPQCEMPTDFSFENIRQAVDEGINPLLLDKMYSEGCSIDIPSALWLAQDIEDYGYPQATPERGEGNPVRVMVVDHSEKIGVSKVGLEKMSPDHKVAITERLEIIWNRMFADLTDFEGVTRYHTNEPIVIVTDPAEADVVLELTVSYPFAGRYGFTGNVSVYNCVVDIRAWQPGTENEVTASYSEEAEDTIRVSAGATEVWMKLPTDIDNQIGTTIQSWF